MTHDAETTLKPCPFCGGGAPFWGRVRDGKSLFCNNCGAGFTQFYGLDDITERLAGLWNTRADLDAMQPTVADAAQDLMQLALESLPVDMPRRREVLAQIAALRALSREGKT